MTRYGIKTAHAFGVPVPQVRAISKKIGCDHSIAKRLWATGVHEARLLAGMIDNPLDVDEEQMEKWASEFDSWDVVDQTCGNLFDKTEFAIRKAHEWSGRQEEFVKRAGFVLMAELAVHDGRAKNQTFLDFLPLIEREASDDRNFVKKAVNWALRQIGKRNLLLNRAAIETCKKIQLLDSRPSTWISADALRELRSATVQTRPRPSKGMRTKPRVAKRPRVVGSSRRTR